MKQMLYYLLFLAICWRDVSCIPYNVSEPDGKSFDLAVVVNNQQRHNPIKQTYNIPKPMDCFEVRLNGNTKDGFYTIFPRSRNLSCNSVDVYCDMESDGSGWTVIQRRGDYKNPINYFSKTWNQYKKGFGSLMKEFWLGNDKIHAITNQASYKVRFDLRHPNGTIVLEQYETFWIDNEYQQYTLHIDEYSGNGTDAMDYHKNKKFSTKDRDHTGSANCGTKAQGGWWFGSCLRSNLNGLNTQGTVGYDLGIHWNTLTGWTTSLAHTEIKIQPNTI